MFSLFVSHLHRPSPRFCFVYFFLHFSFSLRSLFHFLPLSFFLLCSEHIFFSGLCRALILDEAVQRVCFHTTMGSSVVFFFPLSSSSSPRYCIAACLPSLAKGDATGHTRLWSLHLFTRSIADLTTAIDHGSEGPCAERKAQQCARLQRRCRRAAGHCGEEKKKKKRKREGTGQLTTQTLEHHYWQRVCVCALASHTPCHCTSGAQLIRPQRERKKKNKERRSEVVKWKILTEESEMSRRRASVTSSPH